MLLIGSQALAHHGLCLRNPADTDYICTFEQFQKWSRDNKSFIKQCQPFSDTKFHVLANTGHNFEFEIAWEGTAARQLLDIYNGEGVASVDWLYALKMSHRYLKNSVHFLKTMRDIQMLREHISPDAQLIIDSDWFKQREKETYVYKTPTLNKSSSEFFSNDGLDYVYQHDTIHVALAIGDGPAYISYLADGAEVMTSKDKFFSVTEEKRLLGGLEEALVLSAERSQIPFNYTPKPRDSFNMALMKVCTSITSGYFRQFCWESYDKIQELYDRHGGDSYVEKIKDGINKGIIKLENK